MIDALGSVSCSSVCVLRVVVYRNLVKWQAAALPASVQPP